MFTLRAVVAVAEGKHDRASEVIFEANTEGVWLVRAAPGNDNEYGEGEDPRDQPRNLRRWHG
jgi:hypothetical protein